MEVTLSEARFRAVVVFFIVNGLLFIMMFIHAAYQRNAARPRLAVKMEMVRTLGLTDLSLFTEARYTRHPSMTDLNTPFQDYPMSLEHFPSGALVLPPPHLVDRGLD
ncbi:MAG: hypothetical protein HZB33_11690 [Nitrospirae bacterium]|nr:hypothetical protein [Nitrospirota bacterium]